MENLCPRRAENGMPAELQPYMNEGGDIHDGRCIYCGSVTQEEFFKFVEDGGEVGPTDKSYKVYIHGHAKSVKFYFQHLDEAGQARFIELVNAGKMKIGYPGYFYTLPYFCARIPSSDANKAA